MGCWWWPDEPQSAFRSENERKFNPKLKPESLILIRINLVKTSIKKKSYGSSLLTQRVYRPSFTSIHAKCWFQQAILMLLWLGLNGINSIERKIRHQLSSSEQSVCLFWVWHAASFPQTYNNIQLSLFVYEALDCCITAGTLIAGHMSEILENIQPLHTNLE